MLGESIGDHVFCANVFEGEIVMLDVVSAEVMVMINVFGSVVVLWVVCEAYCALVVAMYHGCGFLVVVEFFEKVP